MNHAYSIFLIDDDQDDREIFQLVVHNIDPSLMLFTAIDGKDAIHMIEKGLRPNLIFLDLNMPLMNGREFLKVFRQKKEMNDVPVYIYTTSDSENHEAETKLLGAAGFITKPDNTDSLQKVLTGLMTI